MDTQDYKQPRFDEIEKEVRGFLKKIGYRDKKAIQVVPFSGFQGENLAEKSTKMTWYKGPTLLEAIDNLPAPKRPTDLPLRLPL
jgi:elongation factor 1-alpha